MSRVAFSELVFKGTNPVRIAVGQTIYVYKRGTTEQAVLWSAEAGGKELAQPLEVSEDGEALSNGSQVWVEPASYDLKVGSETVPWEAAKGGESGGGGAVSSVNGKVGAVVLAAADVGAQPSDADLTAIAALSTTEFGRSLLTMAAASNARTALELGSAATQASSAFDAAGAASTAETNAKAASQPLDGDLTAIAALTTTSFGRELLTKANAEAVRTAIEAQKTLGSESIETTQLKALAVTEAKLAAEAVATGKIKLLAITEALLASEAVGEGKVKANAVSEGKLASAVQTKLKGSNVEEHGFSIVSTVEAVTYRGWYSQVASGETKKLVGMKYSIGSGTSAKFSVKQNGTAVTEFKEKTAETTAGEVTGKSVSVAAGDRFDLTVETVTGTPKDLIVTLWFENTR